MFEVNLKAVTEAIDDLQLVSRRLRECRDEVEQCLGILNEFSYLDEPNSEIRKCLGELCQKEFQAVRMRRALEMIQQDYINCEKKICSECEEGHNWFDEMVEYGRSIFDLIEFKPVPGWERILQVTGGTQGGEET